MFKNKDASAEIAALMESNLITHAVEKQQEHLGKFAKALDYLNSVAEIFDELGLRREAEATTTLLEVVAAKKSKKKPSKSKKSKKPSKSRRSRKTDPATKGLTSKKMLDNLAHKGWVFNVDDDFSFAEDHHDGCMCSMCMDVDDRNYEYDMSFMSDSNDTDPDFDPDSLYEGDFDLEDPDEDDTIYSGITPVQRGRMHRDDPYGFDGVSDRFGDFEDEVEVPRMGHRMR